MSNESYIFVVRGVNPIKPKGAAMMKNLNANQQNSTLQQKQVIMMGGRIKTVQKNLSPEEIRKIGKNYRLMYFSFTSINWSQGMTLGMAWQKALEQMDSFIVTKTKLKNHPMNNELMKIHAEFRRDMSKHIMTSEYAEDKLKEHHKKSFRDYGEEFFKKSKTYLDGIYGQYMPKQKIAQQPKFVNFKIAQQKTQNILQQILLQQNTYEHAA